MRRIISFILVILMILAVAPTAFAADDTTPPTLDGVTLNTYEFNRGDTLTVTVHSSELESGFDLDAYNLHDCHVNFISLDPDDPEYSNGGLTLYLTNLCEGGIQGSVVLDKMIAGTYSLSEVYLSDKRGNFSVFADCYGNLPKVSFTLTSDYVPPPPEPNPQRPALTWFNMDRTTAKPGDVINFTMTGTDPTGIVSGSVIIYAMDSMWTSPYYINLSPVTDKEGTLTGMFTVPADMPEGRYQIEGGIKAGSGYWTTLNSCIAPGHSWAEYRLNIINPSVKPLPANPIVNSYSISTHELCAGQPISVTVKLGSVYSMIHSLSAFFGAVSYDNTNKKGFHGDLDYKGNGVFTGTIIVPLDTFPGEYDLYCFDTLLPNQILMGFRFPKSEYIYDKGGNAYPKNGMFTVKNPESVSGTDNRTLMQGDAFDPMEGVTANSAFNGDITGKIRMAGGDIDTNVPGVYLIKYMISDTINNGGTDYIYNYTDYRWIGVTRIEPEEAAQSGEVPLSVTDGNLEIGASAEEVSIKKDGSAIPYSSEITEPGEYTLSCGGASAQSMEASGAHIMNIDSGDMTISAVIDRSGPDIYASWRKDASTGLVCIKLKARDLTGVTGIKYMAGDHTLAEVRDGGSDYKDTISTAVYGKYTAYSKDRLGNESCKVFDINVAYSDSAYLWDIDITAGKLSKDFSGNVYKYTINLGEDEESVIITPEKECDDAVMTINGEKKDSYEVDVGNNRSKTVKVVVSYGSKKNTYTFTVKRAISNNAWLKSITAISGGKNLDFEETFGTYLQNYTLDLSENTKSVTISVTPVNSTTRTSFKTKTFTLNYGKTKNVSIYVRAQSGFGRYYYITITRAACSDATLKYIKTSSKSCVLAPDFSADKQKYSIVMPQNCSSFTLSAKTAGHGASMTIGGKKVSSRKITLKSGESTEIIITVTAQDGGTKDYIVDISRL